MTESHEPIKAARGEQRSGARATLPDIRRILVFACNLLGDSICRLPAIEAAKNTYRGSHLTAVADPVYREVFEGQPFIDEVWPLSRRGSRLRQAREWLSLMRRARRARPDLVLDLYGSKRTAFASRVSGARYRTGLQRDGLSGWYNLADRVHADARHRGHIIERINAAVAPAGIAAPFAYRRLSICDDEQAAARDLLQAHGAGSRAPTVLLNPSARVPAKRWPAEQFARLAETLSGHHGAHCHVITAPGAQVLGERVASDSHGAATALPEMSIKELAAVMERADVLVTGDTGVLHVGSAMGTPSVVLAGPTDPRLFAHPNCRQVVLFHREACERWDRGEQCSAYNTCPDRRCIEAISVDEAAAAVQRVLRE
jgi:ADP-heptose:LPS heptosyltransferase